VTVGHHGRGGVVTHGLVIFHCVRVYLAQKHAKNLNRELNTRINRELSALKSIEVHEHFLVNKSRVACTALGEREFHL
jgi:hypothetical protein